MSQASPIVELLARRRLHAYEERSACRAYAYGVDVRRSQWWMQSTLGGRMTRAMDRLWPRLLEQLQTRWGATDDRILPRTLAEELDVIVGILRTAAPCVHLIHPRYSDTAPLLLPVSSANGLDTHLFLDPTQLLALPALTRQFLLGRAVAHLQCGHGVYFSGQLLIQERSSHRSLWPWLRPILRPWSRVMVFSADRAGAGACGSIEAAKIALDHRFTPQQERYNWDREVPMAQRKQAMEDFSQSSSFARLSRLREIAMEDSHHRVQNPSDSPDKAQIEDPFRRLEAEDKWKSSPKNDMDELWSLAYCDQRLTEALGIF